MRFTLVYQRIIQIRSHNMTSGDFSVAILKLEHFGILLRVNKMAENLVNCTQYQTKRTNPFASYKTLLALVFIIIQNILRKCKG